MTHSILNVGRAIPGSDALLTYRQVAKACSANGLFITGIQHRQSGTEPTFILRAAESVSALAVYRLAERLGQEAIAFRDAQGNGSLEGPLKEAWGEFNAGFFLEWQS